MLSIIQSIATQISNEVCSCDTHIRYLNTINDFPHCCIIPRGRDYSHYSGSTASRYSNIMKQLKLDLRGYTHNNDQDAIEILLRQLEIALGNVVSPNIYVIQVDNVETDTGLLLPYGVCTLRLTVLYEG